MVGPCFAEHELVHAERVGEVAVEALEAEVDPQRGAVLGEELAHGIGVLGLRAANHSHENARVTVVEGFVVAEQDVPSASAPGDTAEVRVTIDASSGCELLEQRVIRFAPGRSLERGEPDRQEVLFVVEGSGVLDHEGERRPLEPWNGVFVGPGVGVGPGGRSEMSSNQIAPVGLPST